MNQIESTIYLVIEIITNKLQAAQIEFVFAGSVATLLQGCTLAPNDVDIQFFDKGSLIRAITLFESNLELVESEGAEMDKWLSSCSKLFIEFADPWNNQYTFSRFIMNGLKIELAYIHPLVRQTYIAGLGIWENGPDMWPHIKSVQFESLLIPVIPLEIQLETNLNRDKSQRVNEIMNHFKISGYNEQLLKHSLSEGNLKRFAEMIEAR